MSSKPLIINDEILIRNFEWFVDVERSRYILSEVFEVNLGNLSSKWQIEMFCTKNYDVHAHIHRVGAFCDFRIIFDFGIYGSIEYDGEKLNKAWISLFDFDNSVTVSIFIPLDYTSKMATDGILLNYAKFFNSDTLSDFKFICSDGKALPAHRVILAAHSPVMQSMLMTPMFESKSQTCQLADIDSKTMLEVLRFLYTGKIENFENLAPNLLYCAEKYQIDVLKRFLIQSMIKKMNCSNVLKYLECAERFSDEIFFDFCVYFIKRNYRSLCGSKDWMKMDFKTKNYLKVFSRSDVKSSLSDIYTSTNLPVEYEKFK